MKLKTKDAAARRFLTETYDELNQCDPRVLHLAESVGPQLGPEGWTVTDELTGAVLAGPFIDNDAESKAWEAYRSIRIL